MQLSSAMNMHVQYLFRFLLWLLSGVYPGVKLLDHVVIVCLLFWGVSFCSPEWLHYFTCYQPCTGFRFLHSFTNTCYFIFYFFNISCLNGHEVRRLIFKSNMILLFSCSVMSNSLQPHGQQHARLPCPSPSPRVCSDSCLLSQWCHPTTSSSVAPFSSCPQNTCMILQNKIYRETFNFYSWMENPPSCSFPSFQ